jgi:hypothetical protein
VVQQGKAVDKPMEVCDVLVLDPKVIDNEAKGNLGRDVAEERGGRGL